MEWLRAVGAWSYAARSARAERHLEVAERAPDRSTLAKWHRDRARGQLERIERVEKCGLEHFELACKACGCVADHEHDRVCSSWRYCVECRGRRAHAFRDRINEAREQWQSRARSFERERFLTVTIPHAGVGDDVRVLLKSWSRFTRAVRRWTRRRGQRDPSWVRALEVTSSDGGHAHMHAWVGSSFLPHAVLRVLWGRALAPSRPVPERLLSDLLPLLPDERSRAELMRVASWRRRACAGDCEKTPCRRRHSVPWPVLDVRKAHGDVGNELVKYLIKDVDQGELIDPLDAANLIEATEGARTLACSLGFWVVELSHCSHCDAPAAWLVLPRDSLHKPGPDVARGPPLSFIQEA